MVTISGVFLDPDGAAVAGAVITFTQLKNTTDSFLRREATMTTAEDGSYSVQLYNGRYKVMAKYRNNSEAKLGEINVSDSTEPGTLNDYLLVGATGDMPSPLFMAVEKMYFDMLVMMGDFSKTARSVDGIKPDETGNIELNAYTPSNPPVGGGAQIPLPGEPGSSILASMSISGGTAGNAYKKIGQTVPGSQMRPACLLKDKTQATTWTEVTPDFTSTLSGTWACAGYVAYGFGVTLWTRIDQPVSVSSSLRLQESQQPVRNCRFSSREHLAIDCEILNGDQWLPFTASITDTTAYGPVIYSNALAGMYGPVKDYAESTRIDFWDN